MLHKVRFLSIELQIRHHAFLKDSIRSRYKHIDCLASLY